MNTSLLENEIHGQHQEHETYQVIHSERFVLEKQERENNKDRERDHFLDHLQLHQGKRPAVLLEADAVCRHLQQIFEQGDAPADEDDADESKALAPLHLLEFEMPIPRQRHKSVGQDEKAYGYEGFHSILKLTVDK